MSQPEKVTWPSIAEAFRPSPWDCLQHAFLIALARFKPKNLMEEIAIGQAPSRFTAWITTLTEQEAEAIRREMIEALGGYTSRD